MADQTTDQIPQNGIMSMWQCELPEIQGLANYIPEKETRGL